MAVPSAGGAIGGTGVRLLAYGEAMLRLAPTDKRHDAYRGMPSAASGFLRTVGGDELNVCVALSRLGQDAAFASVLPPGPLGAVVWHSAAEAGVKTDYMLTRGDEGADVGTYYVLPEKGCVHYSRRHSAFALQPPGLFNWTDALKERGEAGWLHATGITPMLGKQPLECWAAAIQAADSAGSPVSLDLNYRPQLGPFEHLWLQVAPKLSCLDLLILSAHSTQLLAEHLDGEAAPPAKRLRVAAGAASDAESTHQVTSLLQTLHSRLAGPALACCLKTSDADGCQRRWSVIVDGAGVHSTEAIPTLHTPKDELGGGSAWAAGVIDALSQSLALAGRRRQERRGSTVVLGHTIAVAAARRGDLLAALAQESPGDFSLATRADLEAVEQRFAGEAAVIDGAAAGLASFPPSTADAAKARVEAALKRMDESKVIAIIRARHETRAVERAIELADLGYRAIEVTADSAGFAEGRLMPAVCAAVGGRCLVGIGTVTTVAQLELAARGGAHFALSPVRPTAGWDSEGGFVRACHRLGVLAQPAAFTPQEIYECVQAGALTVKIFPAQLWSPSALRDLCRIGCFGTYRLCPSGGIDCSKAEAWLDAGAYSVGMGSCLVGKDVATAPDDVAGLSAAEVDWRETARPNAVALAARLGFVPK